MDRKNYLKVVDRLGYGRIYNFSRGTCEDFTCDTRIDIGNSEGKATEVLERIVAYVDALLYDADHYEPTDATDVFDFVVEDERYTLDLDNMIHDADEAEWKEWEIFRKKLLNAEKANVAYEYGFDTICPEDLVDHAMKRMLADLLADGRLADCVSMQMKVYGQSGCCYLWMNGMNNGRYVCGEIPFEQNEALVRSCGGWSLTNDDFDEGGVLLRLHPKNSQTLLNRARETAKTFSQKIDCEIKLMLSYEDFRNNYIEWHAAMEDTAVSCVDKTEDDRQQRNFPDLRVYFTSEEKQALLDRYPTLSRKFIQYADSSYTEDDLERIRFLWTLALLGKLEGPKIKMSPLDKIKRPTSEAFMNAFNKLPEDIRRELYGISNYDLSMDFMKENDPNYPALMDACIYQKHFFDKHSGVGDLSIMDDELYASMRSDGYYLQVKGIHLKDIDDVHLMCDFMNELQEIERLAQAETGEPISEAQKDKRFDGSLASQWWDFADRWGQEERIPEMTIHEYHEQALKAALVDMNIIMNDGMNDGDLEFAADESSLWARLRFRLENGKYIYEIAQADV